MSKQITIITSLYRPKNIQTYFQSLVNQSVFNLCEPFIYEVGVKEKNKEIDNLSKKFGVNYKTFSDRLSIYEVWDKIIEDSPCKYFANMNFDDFYHPLNLEKRLLALEINDGVDVAYGPLLETSNGGETFDNNSSGGRMFPCAEFDKKEYWKVNSVHACIFARRSLWEKIGGFSSGGYKICADYWWLLKAINSGSVFRKVSNTPLGLYYRNPEGASTGENTAKGIEEIKKIREEFGYE